MNDAFSLVDNLKIKIKQLLKPSDLNSVDSHSREILKLVYEQVHSFEEIAKTTLPSDLQREISSEVGKLRVIVDQTVAVQSSDDKEVELVVHDVDDLQQRFDSFNRGLKLVEQRCVDGLYNTSPDEEEEEGEEEDDNPWDAATSEMIGVQDVYKEVKDHIMKYDQITSLVGMPGVGKTTLAKKIFNDPELVQCFHHRVWVRVGKKCRLKDIPRRILAEIDPDMLTGVDDDEEAIYERLNELSKSKCYLIVLDDVWDRYITWLWLSYKRSGINHPFFRPNSACRILLTSRLQQLHAPCKSLGPIFGVFTMRLLNKEESWYLFCDKIFREGQSCPPQLTKVGKKISKKCEGLPLTIITVAFLLSQEENNDPEYWYEVATKRNHPIFMNAYDKISKVLLPSYTYLSPLLKMCFLYIGLFPQNYEIPRTKLISLWLADRFLELNIYISFIDAVYCLEELVTNNIVMVYKKSAYNLFHTVKTCGLHSSLWHLSKQKARETRFGLILSNPNDCIGDGMEGHPRLSIHNNVLFCNKSVHKSVEDNCASAVHSLLCFGPYHQYQVPLCFRLKLLRELDALSIRFYEFPLEVLQLVRLTYLALTSNGKIPTSICQLKFLEFFFVNRHQSIKSSKDASYLPLEIWSLKKLWHLQVVGSDMPEPHGASLDNLTILSKVSARSCTEGVLKGLPNLNKLSIQIELTPDDDKPLSCFAHDSHLSKLGSLRCVIVNPRAVPPVVPFSSFFGENLVRLYLSGLGYPWKEMKMIASLQFLSVLKIKNHAFQGPDWEVEESGFIRLVSLVIEDVDIVNWKWGCGAFKKVCSLVVKNCYKLEKIHGKFGEYVSKIEIVDCNPLCVVEMKKAIPEEAPLWVLDVQYSWDDKKLKT